MMPGYKYRGDHPEATTKTDQAPPAADVWMPRAEAEKRVLAAETTARQAVAALHRERGERAAELAAARASVRDVERSKARAAERARAAAEAEAEALRAAAVRAARAATTNRQRLRRALRALRELHVLREATPALPMVEGGALAFAEVRVAALEGALADSCRVVEDLTAQRDYEAARAITFQARLDMIHAQSRVTPEKREQTR